MAALLFKRWGLHRRTSVLTLANLAIVGLVLWRVFQGTQVDWILDQNPTNVSLQRISTDEPRFNQTLDVLQSQALFHTWRTFYVPPPAPVEEVRPPQPDYRFVGVIVVPGKPKVAVLSHNQTKARLKVSTGDVIESWTVKAVEPKRVLLRFDNDEYEINSRSSAGGGTAAPGEASGFRKVGSTPGSAGVTRSSSGVKVLSAGQAASPQNNVSGSAQAVRLYQPPPR